MRLASTDRRRVPQHGSTRWRPRVLQPSLGAQPKIALFYDGHRWCIPRSGALTTTHIVKLSGPVATSMDSISTSTSVSGWLRISRRSLPRQILHSRSRRLVGHCRRGLDRHAGHSAVSSASIRRTCARRWRCRPLTKYENEGGTGGAGGGRTASEGVDEPADIETFIDALALNWVIGGTDAHTKNFIRPHRAGLGVTRAAPITCSSRCRIRCALPYRQLKGRDARRPWITTSGRSADVIGRGSPTGAISTAEPVQVHWVTEVTAAVLCRCFRSRYRRSRRRHPARRVLDRLEEEITKHAESCLQVLG